MYYNERERVRFDELDVQEKKSVMGLLLEALGADIFRYPESKWNDGTVRPEHLQIVFDRECPFNTPYED